MLGTSDWEFVCGVEVDDLWDGVKGRAVLSQHILAIFILCELHVHETLAAPVGEKNNFDGEGDKTRKRVGVIQYESEKEKCRGEK